MAKLNSVTSRQASALIDDEDDAYLRPATPASPQRRTRSPRAARPDPSEQAEAFLRTRRRTPPRKVGWLRTMFGSRLGRWALGLGTLLVLAALVTAGWAIRSFLEHDAHFRIDNSDNIQTVGTTELSRTELLKVFGSDIGRNIFFVPLAKREAVLEAEPWVRHAIVMRLLPDTLRVAITERVPVAFVRVGHDISLVDADGVILPVSPATLAARHYSFPVVTGLDPNAAPADRAAQMHLYAQFVGALDANGAHNTAQLSEVDLSDTDDIRAVVPAQGTDILLHFGNSDYLNRWKGYQEHIASWRQQYPNLSAVDLRYDRQVVLKMSDAAQADQSAEAMPLPGTPPPAAHAPASAAPRQRTVAVQRHAEHPAPAKHHVSHWKPHYIAHAGRAQ